MRNSFLQQRVNLYISIAFIASFGFLLTTNILKALELSNPIEDHVSALVAEAY